MSELEPIFVHMSGRLQIVANLAVARGLSLRACSRAGNVRRELPPYCGSASGNTPALSPSASADEWANGYSIDGDGEAPMIPNEASHVLVLV
jgi:hypothetical protein